MQCYQVKNTSYARAFSLVELVIVVTIIGIISAIAVPRFSSATTNAENGQAKATARVLEDAATLYLLEHPTDEGATWTDDRLTKALQPDSGAVLVPQYLRTYPTNSMFGADAILFIEEDQAIGQCGRKSGGSIVAWVVRYDGNVRIGYCDALASYKMP